MAARRCTRGRFAVLKDSNSSASSPFATGDRSVRTYIDDVCVSERVLDPSDDCFTMLLVVAVRVLRDPVLALDAATEALAAAMRDEADGLIALERLAQVIDAALDHGRVHAVERRRNRHGDTTRLTPEMRAEIHSLASVRLDLDDDVMRVIQRLERQAPSLGALRGIVGSGLVVGVEDEVRDRDGA